MNFMSYEHLVEECPTIPVVREMFGDCNTYNSNWRDHPNFSWKPQPPQYKQHVQATQQASNLEQAMVNLSKVMGDFVGAQKSINAHLSQRIDSVESSLNKRMDEVQNDLSQKIDNLQDSISRFANLNTVQEKGNFPSQPYQNSKDIHEMEAKRKIFNGGNAKMMKEKEEKREFWPLVLFPLSGHIWSTFSSPFYTYYIPFEARIRKSNASNGIQIGVKTKSYANFAHLNPRCEHFRTVKHLLAHECHFAHPSQFSHRANQGAKISHTTIQGAKFIPRCENLSPRCEFSKHQFHTPLFKVRKFSHRRNHLLAHGCHFAHLKPLFAPCKTRCENFAHHNSRCEIQSNKLWPFEDNCAKLNGNFAAAPHFSTVGHVFGALPGAQIMHTIYRFEAWEVRNPVLQTVSDLDLKRRSYGHLKTDYTKLSGNFAP
ncbi:hypothetical protein AAG906_004824 [Vitis piasezkii]